MNKIRLKKTFRSILSGVFWFKARFYFDRVFTKEEIADISETFRAQTFAIIY